MKKYFNSVVLPWIMAELVVEIKEFMHLHKVLNLAYTDHNNVPQACALWFVSDDSFNLYVLSSLSTLHGQTLQHGGSVAFTINKDDQDWRTISGIQGRGEIQLVDEPAYAWSTYTSKYEFILQQFPELDDALQKTKLWVIQPTWLRLIDNSKGFGHKEELKF